MAEIQLGKLRWDDCLMNDSKSPLVQVKYWHRAVWIAWTNGDWVLWCHVPLLVTNELSELWPVVGICQHCCSTLNSGLLPDGNRLYLNTARIVTITNSIIIISMITIMIIKRYMNDSLINTHTVTRANYELISFTGIIIDFPLTGFRNTNWYLNWDTSLHKDIFEIVVFIVSAILFRPQYVNMSVVVWWTRVTLESSGMILTWWQVMILSHEYQVPLSRLLLKVHNLSMAFAQDCGNSIDNALDLLQSCAKPLNWTRIVQIFKQWPSYRL